MKIPKYVEKLIERRRKLAYELIEVDAELNAWLEKYNVPLDGEYTASERRRKLAYELVEFSTELDDWLENHDIRRYIK